jgi:hypothetical protein
MYIMMQLTHKTPPQLLGLVVVGVDEHLETALASWRVSQRSARLWKGMHVVGVPHAQRRVIQGDESLTLEAVVECRHSTHSKCHSSSPQGVWTIPVATSVGELMQAKGNDWVPTQTQAVKASERQA